MFEVIVKKTLSASHALKNCGGKDEIPHEHEWTIEAKFRSDGLDESGCAIDFRDIDRALGEILTPYKAKALGDFEPFQNLSPSAENFARLVFDSLSAVFKDKAARPVSVTAWEDASHGATYSLS